MPAQGINCTMAAYHGRRVGLRLPECRRQSFGSQGITRLVERCRSLKNVWHGEANENPVVLFTRRLYNENRPPFTLE